VWSVPKASEMFSDEEVLEGAANGWWIFLLAGIAWLIFSLIMFRFDYTTVHSVSILFGIVAIAAGVSEFMAMGASTTGWKIVRAILGVIFIAVGIVAFAHPGNTFVALASVIGFFFLFKGIFDMIAAFATRGVFPLWWIQLTVGIIELGIAIWASSARFSHKATLLVFYVGLIALSKGITDVILAFKLKGVKRELAAA
jgi:uncharacterized membrane protein HdeD (DUF308 family)